jgi:hypothetical protein
MAYTFYRYLPNAHDRELTKIKNERLKVTAYYSLSSKIRDEVQRNKSSDLHLNTIFYYNT